MDRRLRLLSFAALLVFLTGCPLSSDLIAPDVQGIWDVTFTSAGGKVQSGTAAVIEGGPAFIFTDDGNVYGFATPLKDEHSVDGGLVKYTPQCVATACHLEALGFAGSAYGDHIVLTLDAPVACPGGCTVKTTPAGKFALDRSSPMFQPIFQVGQTDAVWQGNYLPTTRSITLTNKAGSLTGTDGFGCAVSMSVDQLGNQAISSQVHAQAIDLAKVTLKDAFDPLTGTCIETLTGVGYYSSIGTGPFVHKPGAYFFAGIYGSDTGLMLEFKVR